MADQLGGPSELERLYVRRSRLGDGMTACVYVVEERATGKILACKLAERRHHRSVWGRLSQLLRRESALLREIGEHPCLVGWHAYHESPHEVAIVMELVPGGDCQQLLQRHGALAEQVVQPMIAQLHSALQHLHCLGVVHRDVKLENVLIERTRTMSFKAKLCDLGHACRIDEARLDHAFFGTPGYTAPEVVRGPVWSTAADVWAMGVVMYALLANSLPFEADTLWRPPDFSGRAWWQVSLDAKLLLQSLLESVKEERATISEVARSSWLSSSARAPPPPGLRTYSYSCAHGLAKPLLPQRVVDRQLPMTHAASWSSLDSSTLQSSIGAQMHAPHADDDDTTAAAGASLREPPSKRPSVQPDALCVPPTMSQRQAIGATALPYLAGELDEQLERAKGVRAAGGGGEAHAAAMRGARSYQSSMDQLGGWPSG